jgi:hypothetical protein
MLEWVLTSRKKVLGEAHPGTRDTVSALKLAVAARTQVGGTLALATSER